MRDTVITAAFKRRELTIIGLCLVAAVAINAGAILWFQTRWSELFTQIGYEVILASVLYATTVLIRLFIAAVRKIVKGK